MLRFLTMARADATLPHDDARGAIDYFGQPDCGSAGVSFRAFL
jgi:hypothetical protein